MPSVSRRVGRRAAKWGILSGFHVPPPGSGSVSRWGGGGGGGGWWFSFQLAPTVPAPLLCKLVGQPQCLWCGVVARGVYEALAGVVRPGGKA